ncbi:methyltransferase domain-containing protein [Maridesulfovibrio hydrothermalis]|uniref:Methyltransferase domain-containing protein n=1 Tax=Maridesulfovibrio hydrothermalis AM13 = DSM 14728 TaxID=1121451 RepID=L0R9H2_9BACT|nr:methyltransferase domain-containing protein [Maridesulfovibrio hydrothermalis]CCO22241.1 protein of unknown function [Maridesulfovibrio hydrothermalis AM13 = DSM 14728]
MKFNLGGRGINKEFTTVNMEENCDIKHDLLDVDGFIPSDNVVSEFRMIHTLEHIPTSLYVNFLKTLKRKLKPGGKISVVLTDAEAAMNMWKDNILSFRAMKKILFPPAQLTGLNQLMAHHNMWNTLDLARDFQALGFEVYSFDAGYWTFDLTDEFFPEEMAQFQGLKIKNIGVMALLRG